MLLLAIFFVVLFFLVVGVAVFGMFVTIPRARPFALSAALWCACWGPCIVALEMLAGLTLAAEGLAVHHWGRENVPLPGMPVWSTYALLGLVGTVLVATVAAWLHQMMIGRMTFALFRVYVTGVMTGMGSVAGWVWSIWLATLEGVPGRFFGALAGMALLTVGFGVLGCRYARGLRGQRPEALQWISVEEFEGVQQG
jgi:hypothetical protein